MNTLPAINEGAGQNIVAASRTRSALAGAFSMDNCTAVLTLYDNGMIRDCNKAGGKLLGCSPTELTWQHISRFLPQLKEIVLVRNSHLNPYLRFLSRVGHHFEVIGLDGAHFAGELFFSEMENLGRHLLRIIICPVEPQAV